MQPLLIAVLPVAGVLVGAALQFVFGRSLEARKQLTVQRADSYIDFFRAMAALAQDQSKEQLVAAANAKTRICLYGSEAVVQRLADFERSGATAGTDAGQAALLTPLRAMRKDVSGYATSLPDDDLAHILFARRGAEGSSLQPR